MTNLYTKIVIIAVSALIVTLTGCKKDDELAASFVLETTSLDFEWGQTKELSFTTHRVTGFGEMTVPEGWTCIRNKNKYIITSPASASNAELSGSISVSAKSDNDATMTRYITVAVKIAEEITDMANCIIVSEPSKRYKFNALRRAGETTETITGAVSATRLWTTSNATIANVSLEGKYLYFSTGTSSNLPEGNAVVAVTDSNGDILWSWHIWVTDYNPADDPDMMGGKMVMNRNLGAFRNSNVSAGEVLRSYGLYYQWGRKDPFVGPQAWNSSVQRAIFNSLGRNSTYEFVTSTVETGTVEYAVSHPATFIAGNEDNGFDWQYSGHITNLWNSETGSKTIYDPCPVGWRVAPPEIWEGFTTTGGATSNPEEFNVEGEYKYGWTFRNGEETVFYPAAGRRSFSPGLASPSRNFTNVINPGHGEGDAYPVGFYWSNRHPAPVVAPALSAAANTGTLVFRNDWINPGRFVSKPEDYAPAGGFPLRCVAE